VDEHFFVGRQAELAALHGHLDDARAGRPTVVQIQGPSGIGKTALVDRFLRDCDGVPVLRASGDEAETLLAYGVVEQFGRHAGEAGAALLAAVDHEPEHPAGDPIQVGMRLLELVGDLEGPEPVVLVVDDAHWADVPSLRALIFALRRLVADHVLTLLLAVEDAVPRLPQSLRRIVSSERGATLRLRGLDTHDLCALAGAMGIDGLSPRAARRLHAGTEGNPLYARSLLEEAPPEAWRQADGPLPSSRSFNLLVRERLAGCGAPTRRLIEAASVLGMHPPLALAGSLGAVDDPLQALDEATKVGLLRPADGPGALRLAFVHPLVRAAIYGGLARGVRARLHAAAVALMDDEGAALRHRVAAATGPDEQLARDIAWHAGREAAREAWPSAASHLVTASRLTPDPADRQQRLLEAVRWIVLSGDAAQAATYGAELATFPGSARRDSVLGYLATVTREPASAERLLCSAWRRCRPDSDGDLAASIALQNAMHWYARLNGPSTVDWSRRAVDLLPPGDPTRPMALTYLAYGLAFCGQQREALDTLSTAESTAGASTALRWLQPRSARGLLRLVDDDLDGARTDLADVGSTALRLGILSTAAFGYAFLARAEYLAGAWDDAFVHAERAVAVNTESDNGFMQSAVLGSATAVPAARGDWATAEAYARSAARLTGGYERGTVAAALARAQVAAARGDHRAVLAAMDPVRHLTVREGASEPGFWPWQDLYAEALVGAGRAEEAAAFLVPHEHLAAQRGRRSVVARLARARGRVEAARGDAAAAEGAFTTGLDALDGLPMPFEEALLGLAYGQFLRRGGQRKAAATALGGARDRFTALGAAPYLVRCDRELAACGVPVDGHGPAPARLTSQELAVARLAASGHTNREAASELVVSVKTVEFHLRNAFQKLGVTARGQLANRLAEARN
jgi:DNA-binding CsgD family transcriptional regulator